MSGSSRYMDEIKDLDLIRYLPKIKMPDRNREIVSKYFLGGYTYKSLGEEYGLSGERIRQLIVKFWRRAKYWYNKDIKQETNNGND